MGSGHDLIKGTILAFAGGLREAKKILRISWFSDWYRMLAYYKIEYSEDNLDPRVKRKEVKAGESVIIRNRLDYKCTNNEIIL